MLNKQANRSPKNWSRFLLTSVLLLVTLTGVFHLAQFIVEDTTAQTLVQNFGYWGVLLVSYIAGLNAIVPVPAGSFVPIFVAGGLAMPLIITMLVIGTFLADMTAYFAGLLGRKIATNKYPRLIHYSTILKEKNKFYVVLGVFLYATFSPLPNELILVPLALMGTPLLLLVPPLLVGTILYQSAFALGITELFNLFF